MGIADTLVVARPAPFMVDMVRAIRADEKTETRRAATPQPKVADWQWIQSMGVKNGRARFRPVAEDWPDSDDDDIYCPYGKVGDLLWVREPWRATKMVDRLSPAQMEQDTPLHFEADDQSAECIRHWGRYRNARFMCRWMSRETLTITRIRLQRLLEVTDDDARAEGIVATHGGWGLRDGRFYRATSPRQSYLALWESINGAGSVQHNPWVWAITFRREAHRPATQETQP